MSTTPPDRPTERLRPSPPPAYDERAGDPNLVLLRLEQTIGSLRTGLMAVGVIAVAALGVAAYALVKANDDGAGGGSTSGMATNERVSQLDDRLDRLSRQVQDARSGDNAGGDDVSDRVEALERTVKTLAERPSTDPQEAIDQLSERIDDVAKDVEALQQGQSTP
jgi:TolA-binding protein